MPNKVVKKDLESGLDLFNINEMLQMTEGLTLTKILKEDDELEKLKERFELISIRYRDAQKTINLCLEEGKALRKKIDSYPPRATIKNTEGAFMKVGKFIAEVVKQLNVHSSMNEQQIDYAASDILTEYGEKLTLKELAWIFRRGIMGNYGKTDFKIDVQTFHTWIQKYLSDKNERISQQQETKAREAEAISERRDTMKRLLKQ